VLLAARKKDIEGRRSHWFMKGGVERESASDIYTIA
jgi:hypothetical protein